MMVPTNTVCFPRIEVDEDSPSALQLQVQVNINFKTFTIPFSQFTLVKMLNCNHTYCWWSDVLNTMGLMEGNKDRHVVTAVLKLA